jgi:biotin carboxylase
MLSLCPKLDRGSYLPKSSTRILVVGTTRDYIDRIRDRMPRRALFLTHPGTVPPGMAPLPPDEELVYPLTDEGGAAAELISLLDREAITLCGITCFDCESLPLAAALAERWGLPFPSRETVFHCRDKYISKKIWLDHGISTPQVRQVLGLEDIHAFMRETGEPVILKPRAGSGSALTFRCDAIDTAAEHYAGILKGLKDHTDNRLFQTIGPDRQPGVICEEWVSGDEFSCDAYINGKDVRILRTARKYFSAELPVGTTLAYEIPGGLPDGIPEASFREQLGQAAAALGLKRGLCMVDFIHCNGRCYFLELSPRLGGDCLPWLIKESCGVDMLELALDFAEGLSPAMPPPDQWEHLIGVRFHADRAGRLAAIRPRFREYNENVRSQLWIRHPGDRIQLPPKDYDMWLLGHIIFSPRAVLDIPQQIRDLLRAVQVDIS